MMNGQKKEIYTYGYKSNRAVRKCKYFCGSYTSCKRNEVEAGSVQIEDIEKTVVNDIEGLEKDEDSSAEVVETR